MVTNDQKDTGLLDVMRLDELPALVVKANRAYREMVTIVGKRDVHAVWPRRYFDFNTQKLRAMVNSLGQFLQDKRFVYCDPSLNTPGYHADQSSTFYCTEQQFKMAYERYCKDEKLTTQRWTADYYQPTFTLYNIVYEPIVPRKDPKKRLYPRYALGEVQKAVAGKRVFFGIDLVYNMSDEEKANIK